jgi:hypothetical protein
MIALQRFVKVVCTYCLLVCYHARFAIRFAEILHVKWLTPGIIKSVVSPTDIAPCASRRGSRSGIPFLQELLPGFERAAATFRLQYYRQGESFECVISIERATVGTSCEVCVEPEA